MNIDLITGQPPKAKPPVPIEEIRDVAARVEAGDKAAAARLRELIALDPDRMIEVTGGNLATQVEYSRIEKLKASVKIFGVSVPAKLDALRAELGGSNPAPIERLLVERVVATWLDLQILELRAAQSSAEMTFRQVEHRERLRDRAHRRYLSALKSLAVVRKLGLVVVLANVDARTVNVGQVGEPDRQI